MCYIIVLSQLFCGTLQFCHDIFCETNLQMFEEYWSVTILQVSASNNFA